MQKNSTVNAEHPIRVAGEDELKLVSGGHRIVNTTLIWNDMTNIVNNLIMVSRINQAFVKST